MDTTDIEVSFLSFKCVPQQQNGKNQNVQRKNNNNNNIVVVVVRGSVEKESPVEVVHCRQRLYPVKGRESSPT
jgi:hypothetical protein